MGQKVNPKGFRIAVTKNWESRWFGTKKEFGDKLHEDLTIRKLIKRKLKDAAISRVQIERFSNRVRVAIYSARPGIVIGRKGQEIENLKKVIQKKIGNEKEILIDIVQIKVPELDATLVAQSVAQQQERRVSHRRAMKKAMQLAMEAGAQGVRIACAGRLGGAELARTEQYREGKVPLHTISADIDYGVAEANTLAGIIGVKVWICKPEIMEQDHGTNAKKSKASKSTKR